MNRRYFISHFGKLSLTTAAAGIAASAASEGKKIIAKTGEDVNSRIDFLRKRVDDLENSQKKILKAMIVVTAFSTGIDLSILI
jgi:hypothetical protein